MWAFTIAAAILLPILSGRTAAQSTTCIAVSRPAETHVYTYSSGEGLLFPPTTLTAAMTTTYIDEPTVVASCFTLRPGETLPPTVDLVGVVCTTDLLSRTTNYQTITSGETNRLFRTT